MTVNQSPYKVREIIMKHIMPGMSYPSPCEEGAGISRVSEQRHIIRERHNDVAEAGVA